MFGNRRLVGEELCEEAKLSNFQFGVERQSRRKCLFKSWKAGIKLEMESSHWKLDALNDLSAVVSDTRCELNRRVGS